MAIGARVAATPPGDALTPGKADPADLRPVEAVRRRERQPRAVAVGEVERADLDAHRDRRPVDDRAHELVPVAGERRQLRDLVEERELVEGGDRRRLARLLARRDVRFAGASAEEVRELIAKCEQVVVLGREFAQLLLPGQRAAKESASCIEPSAEGVETGEVVSGVGGRT